jgi:hypothetical protein
MEEIFMKFRLIGVIALLMVCLGSLPTVAAVVDLVKKDFTVVSGDVVMPAGNEYIIDLDAAQGVTAGDLLAVVEQGEAIIHPVTGKVLGAIDRTVAVLQVSRINTGYSYARFVSGNTEDIAVGSKLQRFSNLSAVFHDETQGHEVLFAQLKTALPALHWREGDKTTSADLLFAATANGLQVRDSQGQLIRVYAPETPVVAAVATTPASAPAAAVAYVAAPAQPPVSGAVTYEQTSQVGSYSGGALNIEFPRFNKVGQLDRKTVMADFERINGQLLLATTDAGAIQVFAVNDGLSLVATGDSATSGQILALSWYQPQNGQAYLTVTVWSDDGISSDLLYLQGNQLLSVVHGYATLIAGFDGDGDGRSERLLSQEFSRETFYGSRVRELSLSADNFVSSAVSVAIPASFRIFGALFADITGNGQAETVFIRNRRLYIYAGDRQLYKSSKELGASISTITYDIDPDAQNPMIANASCEIAPVAVDLDGDGLREIVAIAAAGNIMQAVGVASAIDKSWLAVFKYHNGMVTKGVLGDKLERPLQGLTVTDNRALLVATDAGGLLDAAQASYVLAVPIK